MIIIAGTAKIQDGKIDEVRAGCIQMQNETVKEDGCISYRFYQDLEHPTTIHIFEEWETQAALDSHMNTPHMEAFRVVLGETLAQPPDVTRYEVSSYGKA